MFHMKQKDWELGKDYFYFHFTMKMGYHDFLQKPCFQWSGKVSDLGLFCFSNICLLSD